jgi:hypothetical protein
LSEVGGSEIAEVGWAEGSTRDVILCGGVIRREFSAHYTILDMPGRSRVVGNAIDYTNTDLALELTMQTLTNFSEHLRHLDKVCTYLIDKQYVNTFYSIALTRV